MARATGAALANVPIPDIALRPPGVTPRQWRLAALYPRASSAYEALIAAGYTPVTALASASRALGSAGVQRAMRVQFDTRADSARTLDGLGSRALAKGAETLDNLETRELLAFGLQAKKTAFELGESVEERGDAAAARLRRRRGLAKAYVLGAKAALDATQPEISAETRQRLIIAIVSTERRRGKTSYSPQPPDTVNQVGNVVDATVVEGE